MKKQYARRDDVRTAFTFLLSENDRFVAVDDDAVF